MAGRAHLARWQAGCGGIAGGDPELAWWLVADRPAVVVELLVVFGWHRRDAHQPRGAPRGECNGGGRVDVELGDRLARTDPASAVEQVTPRLRPASDEVADVPTPGCAREQRGYGVVAPDGVACVVEQIRRLGVVLAEDVRELERIPERFIGLVDLALDEHATRSAIEGEIDAARAPGPAAQLVPRLAR